ncbi:LysR family transcriptional regulator [Streptomyces sp. NPDC015127]|uniref:LysR family transcriptional regulator n=1 Tax=Streptomyces sp. NPDC015127 TaxID=3364939 RepID=UPI0036F6739E
MELELRHLRALCAIADAGSVGRAATALGFTQPAMSTQLRRIESLLGERLFTRGSKGVELTAYGAEVVSRARDVLARADALGRRRTATPPGTTRPLRLGATNTPLLPSVVAAMHAAFPDLALSMSSVYATGELVRLLENGELDAALGIDYPGLELRHSPALAHRAIVTAPVFVALPADHPLAHRVEVPLEELAQDTWFVAPDDGVGWPGAFYDACRAAGFAPASVHEFGPLDQLQVLIAAGHGVSAIQATHRPCDGVLVKPLAGTPLWLRHLLIRRRDSVDDVTAEALHHYAAAAYRELVARAPHFQAWANRTYAAPRPRGQAGTKVT